MQERVQKGEGESVEYAGECGSLVIADQQAIPQHQGQVPQQIFLPAPAPQQAVNAVQGQQYAQQYLPSTHVRAVLTSRADHEYVASTYLQQCDLPVLPRIH